MNQPSTKRRKRRRIFVVLALSIGFLGALICSEVALRIYVASRGWTANCYVTGLAFFVPDPYAGHTLRPGLRLRSSSYDVSVNWLGLRGEEILPAKPPDTKRIAVLGGSSVFGYLVRDGQDSCSELQRVLRGCGRPVEVLNAGVPGFNMTQCRHRFEHQIAPLAPDIVILYLGWNDTRYLISKESDQLDKTPPAPAWLERAFSRSVLYGFLRYRLFPHSAPQFAPPASASTRVTESGAAGFEADLLALIASIQAAGAVPVISTQLSASGPSCENLDGYLGSDPAQVAANRKVGQWITEKLRATAHEKQLALIDCAAELPCNQRVLGDAIHLTKEGHRLVAQLWAAGVLPLLDESSSMSSQDRIQPEKDRQ